MSNAVKTTTDHLITKLRNKKVVAITVVIVLVFGGVATIANGMSGAIQILEIFGFQGGCDVEEISILSRGFENCAF